MSAEDRTATRRSPWGLDPDPVREAWRADALCAHVDADSFFPEKGGSVRDAKATCALCPVTAQCLQYALDHDERFGIWGGLSEFERRKLKRSQRPSQRGGVRRNPNGHGCGAIAGRLGYHRDGGGW